MIDEIRRSIAGYLSERNTSPLWGTFIISWCVWNWKIWYVTFFVSDAEVPRKMEYIVNNFSGVSDLLVSPLISTAFILGVVPFISNQVFRMALWFDRGKRLYKLRHERQRTLTVAESRKIVLDATEVELTFQRTLSQRETTIAALEQALQNANLELNKVNKGFYVVIARYGTNEHFKDVTDLLNDQISQHNALRFMVSNPNLGGDPAVDQPKLLIIIYRSKGVIHWVNYFEGDQVSIVP